MSSPAILPRRHPIEHQKNLFQQILVETNCTSVKCLRDVPEKAILHVNEKLINDVPSDAGGGVFGPAPGFGPVPDGSFIPDIPLVLFQQGRFHKELRSLVIGNVANEVRYQLGPSTCHALTIFRGWVLLTMRDCPSTSPPWSARFSAPPATEPSPIFNPITVSMETQPSWPGTGPPMPSSLATPPTLLRPTATTRDDTYFLYLLLSMAKTHFVRREPTFHTLE